MQKCPEVFYENGSLKDFAKFTGKHLHLSLFFDKTAVDNYSTEPQRLKYFPINIKNFFKATCLWNTSRQLLLSRLIFRWKKFLPKKMS